MPIKKEQQILYPGGSIHSAEWKTLRATILLRAGNKCELCGVKNHQLGIRDLDGQFWIETEYANMTPILKSNFSKNAHFFKIVLTIAHLDHNPGNNHPANLRALCQRCHNRHDAGYRSENARKTRERKKGK